jgi:hypothetical protein
MIKMIRIFSGFILCILVLGNCTLFKKQIVKPTVIALPDTLFVASTVSTVSFAKYLDHATVQQYARAFLKSFKGEAAITKNITLTYSEANADFILKVKSLTLKESSRLERITDPKSMYNGREIELNSVECSAVLEIEDVKNKTKKLNNCTNSKTRSEQFTNNRNLDDLVNGANRNNTNYRTKLLDDNICLNLSGDVGRRIWTPVTRRIAGDMSE